MADYIWIVSMFAGFLAGLIIYKVFLQKSIGISTDAHQLIVTELAVANDNRKNLTTEKNSLETQISDLRNQNQEKSDTISSLKAIEPEREAKCNFIENELKDIKNKLEDTRAKSELSEKKCSELETTNKLLEQQLSTLKESIDAANKAVRTEFENMANKILDDKVKSLSDKNTETLGPLLNPLKEKLTEFSQSVETKYNNEAMERNTLKSKIEELVNLNEKMTKETNTLSQALRGDSKVQGDWGELVLERILEASGLRSGEEYIAQSSHHDSDGDRFQPDFRINLPDGKHVIVDSKVSLTAYDTAVRTEDLLVKKQAITEHLKSLKKHMDGLSEKHYSRLQGINSPEIVFMFVPIEPAYILAMQEDPELSTKAWKSNVAIVTSTTLLVSLKTVAHIWRLERQNRNAQKIADEAAGIYDKFVGFLEDFQEIGQFLNKGQLAYSSSLNRLKDGKGSVFKRLDSLKELGVAPKKQIPAGFSE